MLFARASLSAAVGEGGNSMPFGMTTSRVVARQPLTDPFLTVEILALARRQQDERVGERERIDRPSGQHAFTDRGQVHVMHRNDIHRHPANSRGDAPECQGRTLMVRHQDGIGVGAREKNG